MDGRTLALLLVIPAAAVFIYAGWSEYRRFKNDGPATYGLTYDPDTNTTHVGALPDGEESFDPEDFDPATDIAQAEADDGQPADDDAGAADDDNHPDAKEQDRPT